MHVATGVGADEARGPAAEEGQTTAAPQAATGLAHSSTRARQALFDSGWWWLSVYDRRTVVEGHC